jgi:hypothetical protein
MKTEDKQSLLLWIALLGPATVWFVSLQTIYAVASHQVSSGGSMFPVHVLSALLLVFAFAGMVLAFLEWRRLGKGWPKETEGGLLATHRHLAAMGIVLGALFCLLIFAQWLPHWMLPPYQQ